MTNWAAAGISHRNVFLIRLNIKEFQSEALPASAPGRRKLPKDSSAAQSVTEKCIEHVNTCRKFGAVLLPDQAFRMSGFRLICDSIGFRVISFVIFRLFVLRVQFPKHAATLPQQAILSGTNSTAHRMQSTFSFRSSSQQEAGPRCRLNLLRSVRSYGKERNAVRCAAHVPNLPENSGLVFYSQSWGRLQTETARNSPSCVPSWVGWGTARVHRRFMEDCPDRPMGKGIR